MKWDVEYHYTYLVVIPTLNSCASHSCYVYTWTTHIYNSLSTTRVQIARHHYNYYQVSAMKGFKGCILQTMYIVHGLQRVIVAILTHVSISSCGSWGRGSGIVTPQMILRNPTQLYTRLTIAQHSGSQQPDKLHVILSAHPFEGLGTRLDTHRLSTAVSGCQQSINHTSDTSITYLLGSCIGSIKHLKGARTPNISRVTCAPSP